MRLPDERHEPVESYEDVRHEYFLRYEGKIENIEYNIKQSSIKEEDKIKLRMKLIRILST